MSEKVGDRRSPSVEFKPIKGSWKFAKLDDEESEKVELITIPALIGKYFPKLDAYTNIAEYGAIHRALTECRENTSAYQREVNADKVLELAEGIRAEYPDAANFTSYDKAMIEAIEKNAKAIREGK